MSESSAEHTPVMTRQVLESFADSSPHALVDCTIGLGGHAALLLEQHQEMRLVGLDADDRNLSMARSRLGPFTDRIHLIQADFADLSEVLGDLGVSKVDGVVADLGVSNNQIADPELGLSFEVDGPLDMRLDRRGKTTAADLVNAMSEGELSDLLYFQSQERRSRRIARRICQVRRQGRINSTVMLARLVAAAVGENPDAHHGRIHPATRTFLALRMSVNQEVESLRRLLEQLPHVLSDQGRAVIISFHSGEDRLVKMDFRSRAREGVYRLLTKKPLVPDEDERRRNPRSRSAKLRVAEFCSRP